MALTQIGDDKNTKGQNQNQNQNRNQQNNGYGNPKQDARDMEQAHTSIRQAVANPFGTNSSPSRAIAALEQYTRAYVKEKAQRANINADCVVVEQDVAAPSVVVYITTEVEGKTFVIGHAIMLVDFSNPPQPIDERVIQGTTYRHTTTWADAHDDYYIRAIGDTIEAQMNKDISYINAGCTCVDISFIPTEKMATEVNFQSQQINNLLLQVMSGIEGVRALESEDTTRDIKPANRNPDSTIVGEVSLTPTTSILPNGMPVAEDFLIKVSEVPNYMPRENERIRSINNRRTNDSKTFGTISGRIDFMYSEPESSRYQRPQIEDSACFIPDFIVSGVDMLDSAPTLTLFLELIASIGILDTNNPPLYLEAFNPKNVANVPSRNLGGLHAEVRDPETDVRQERINFTHSVDPQKFSKFVRATITPLSSISLEVPSQHPLSGLFNIFNEAVDYAGRDQNAKFYNDRIIYACDVLTDGRFSEKWNSNDPVMLAERSVIPTGYYIDADQNKRDSREIGYLYLSNMDNPSEAYELATDWDQSFLEKDQLVAAHLRKALITEVQSGNFVQYDNVTRVRFDPNFYRALIDALNEARMDVTYNPSRYDGRGTERRRVDDSRYFSREDLNRGYQQYSGRRGNDRGDYSSRRYGNRGGWYAR